MRQLSVFFFFGLILFGTNSIAAPAASCKLLGDNLYNCVPFDCDTSWPEDAKKIVHNKIVGYNKDKECVHIQTNPNGEKITCSYSEESRKYLSIRMKKSSSDLLHIPEGDEMEENILADVFRNECEITGKDGKPIKADDDSEMNSKAAEENLEPSPDPEASSPNNGADGHEDMPSDDETVPAGAIPTDADIDENSDLTKAPLNGK